MSDPRRYFPDWTECPFARGRELEADHNSYLAGGYAEEFGYMATNEWSRGVPVLQESPDRSRKRRGQAQMTHPGYPLRAHPLARGDHGIESVEQMRSKRRAARLKFHKAESVNLAEHGTYFAVHMPRHGGGQTSALETVAKRAAIRLASSIVGLRWSLRHHVTRRWPGA
jgi:hypothetical protein